MSVVGSPTGTSNARSVSSGPMCGSAGTQSRGSSRTVTASAFEDRVHHYPDDLTIGQRHGQLRRRLHQLFPGDAGGVVGLHVLALLQLKLTRRDLVEHLLGRRDRLPGEAKAVRQHIVCRLFRLHLLQPSLEPGQTGHHPRVLHPRCLGVVLPPSCHHRRLSRDDLIGIGTNSLDDLLLKSRCFLRGVGALAFLRSRCWLPPLWSLDPLGFGYRLDRAGCRFTTRCRALATGEPGAASRTRCWSRFSAVPSAPCGGSTFGGSSPPSSVSVRVASRALMNAQVRCSRMSSRCRPARSTSVRWSPSEPRIRFSRVTISSAISLSDLPSTICSVFGHRWSLLSCAWEKALKPWSFDPISATTSGNVGGRGSTGSGRNSQ